MFLEPSDNPYRSPQHVGAERLSNRPLRPGVKARLLASGLLYRRVLLEAPCEAVIEFKGRSLRDTIVVDNQIVVAKISWYRINSQFQFHLPAGDGQLTVEVNLRLGPLLQMRSFTLVVDGQVAFKETNSFTWPQWGRT